MNPAPPPAAIRPRRTWLFVVLGGVLLAASAAGANWAIQPSARGREVAAPPSSPAAPGPVLSVCSGYVDLEQGVIPLYPLQPGRVVKVEVRDNEEVKAGATLFRLDDTLPRAQRDEALAELGAAQVRLDQAHMLARQHADEVAAQKMVIQAKVHEGEAAAAKLKQARRLDKNQLVSEEDVQAATATVAALEAAAAAEKSKLQALEALDPELAVKLAERNVEAKKAQVQKAEFAVKECTITAPAAGTVLRLLVNPGETLGPNPHQPAVYFCPAGKRIVRAEVEQENQGYLKLNQPVTVEDYSDPKLTWKGHVMRISGWYTQRRAILEPLRFNDVRTLECIVAIDSDDSNLRIGQLVRVKLEEAGK